VSVFRTGAAGLFATTALLASASAQAAAPNAGDASVAETRMSSTTATAQRTPLAADDGQAASTDIVVTARRRDERLQDVPVSVSAFSTEALERSTIQTLQDINTITPGFRAGAEGGTVNISISLRGIGQVPLGEASPGVVTYFANVPLPSVGSNLPTQPTGTMTIGR